MAVSRVWTIEEKRAIIAEYETAEHGAKGLVLRQYGLSSDRMRAWRSARDEGVLEIGWRGRAMKATPRLESAEIERLRQENLRLHAELDRARKDIDDRQQALESLGKATALLHDLVSPKSAGTSIPPGPSTS
jgi:transposase